MLLIAQGLKQSSHKNSKGTVKNIKNKMRLTKSIKCDNKNSLKEMYK